MQELQTAIRAGQQVTVRDEPWLVVDSVPFDDVTLITLRGLSDANRGHTHCVLTPFDNVRPLPMTGRPRRRKRDAVLAAAALALANSPLWGQCWTAASADIDLRGWQLEPALTAVDGISRILLADAVGLGKTIQAALIVAELQARGLADRVLILSPASLREQWATELRQRFKLQPTVVDHGSLASMTATLPIDVNPWSIAPIAISSIDLVKRPEVRAAIEAVPFDILVVDEAHHVTPGTDRGAVVADLASRALWLVLVTATPHSGDEAAYRFLEHLGDCGDKLAVFRRSRADLTQNAARRRSRLLSVTPTPAEQALLDATLAYIRTLRRRERTVPGAALLASVIARRAASSAEAAWATLSRRLALLRHETARQIQAPLPWEETENGDADLSDDPLGMPVLDDSGAEIGCLRMLIRLAEAARGASSKIAVLRRLLRRTKEHVLVFSEYRDVVMQVAAALADRSTVAVLHGGLSLRERHAAVRAFTDGSVRTLVATDAAGEGLNLQHRCRVVVNLELPWNPQRVEQRIGRVDRLGQQRRVHALHLVHRQSFEARVIARLERRQSRSHLSTITCSVTDHNIAAARERQLRNLAGKTVPVHSQHPVYATRAKHSCKASKVTLVYVATLADSSGRLVQREVVGVQLLVDRSRLRILSRPVVRALSRDSRVRQKVTAELGQRAAATAGVTTVAARAIEQRTSGILALLNRRSAGQTIQRSLFDRRAEQRAQHQDLGLTVLREHLTRKLQAMRALRVVSFSEPRLVAAWLGE